MTKRLFFGIEVSAPWPNELPKGRLIDEHARHMTLAFLGQVDAEPLLEALKAFPKPSFQVGLFGKSDKILFLPERDARVVAFHVKWLLNEDLLFSYQKDFIKWLDSHSYPTKERDVFLSHVTLARAPFDKEAWKQAPLQLPFIMKAIHLYESTGNLNYVSLWNFPFVSPFEELEHTADIAFLIRGQTLQQIFLNAQAALAFKFPSLLPYLSLNSLKESLDDVIIGLNELILRADLEIGSPLKAVSFHGAIHRDEKGILSWEMIVDV